jgi:hypothetical protein
MAGATVVTAVGFVLATNSTARKVTKPPVEVEQIHDVTPVFLTSGSHGATANMLASEGEYFHVLRDARQKFSILTVKEILQAGK